MVCSCRPTYLGSWGGRIAWAQECKTACSQLQSCYLHSSLGKEEWDTTFKKIKEQAWWPFNPSTMGGRGSGLPEVKSRKPAWPTWWNPNSTKFFKNELFHIPVISATWEHEARESLESRRHRLQWAEIAPLHSSLGNRAELHLKNWKKN